jgi:hypothetical protein
VRGLLKRYLVSYVFVEVFMKVLLERTNLVVGCCKGHLDSAFIAIDDRDGPLSRTGGIGVLGGDSRAHLPLREPESSSFVLRFLL